MIKTCSVFGHSTIEITKELENKLFEIMEDLIKKNPKNKEELCQVSGFGNVKAEKYGEGILKILRESC